MKVIGKKNSSTYICEVKHTEIEKFLGLYYDNMEKLSVDQEIDLGEGYDFHSKTIDALNQTKNFFKSHESTVKAIANGFLHELKEPENLDLTIGEK